MQRKRTNWLPIMVGLLFFLLVSVPYVLAYQQAGEAHKFGGFLLNPIDGNTYLAKMYQGWQGSWRFVLPFTVDQGTGGYLFLYYLLLGHLARISGGSTQLVFHLFRIGSALFLVISIWNFFSQLYPVQRVQWIAYGLALFGSGLGWLGSAFGIFSADFWVAEGYPFLSAYANPHFPLGVAIMLWFLAPMISDENGGKLGLSRRQQILFAFLGFLLAIVMPFGVVIPILVLFVYLVLDIIDSLRAAEENRDLIKLFNSNLCYSKYGQKLVLLVLAAAPVLIYQVWKSSSDPILAAWNVQNITRSPPIWELIIAYSPIFLVAFPGAYYAVKSGRKELRILLIWGCVGLLLLYLPWSLQRRFITGYMIPLAGLAALAIEHFLTNRKLLGAAVVILVVVLIIPTNLMVLAGGYQAAKLADENLYLSIDEYASLRWIEANTDQEAVILASPSMGLYIPAYTGRRVWYGHPLETPDAVRMASLVEDFFSENHGGSNRKLLSGSDYLLYGKRERELGSIDFDSGYELVFESGDTRIYKID